MVRCEGDCEVPGRPEIRQPFHRIGRVNQVVAVVFNRDGHAGFFRDFQMRFQLLDETRHGRLQRFPLQSLGTSTAGDDRLAAQPFGELHFVFETERTEFVLRDAAQFDAVFFQEGEEVPLQRPFPSVMNGGTRFEEML